MTKDNGPNWLDYYQKLAGWEPRQHLVKALEQVELKPDSEKLAIDIGFGDGTETAYLLENGWSVLAVDGEPGSVE